MLEPVACGSDGESAGAGVLDVGFAGGGIPDAGQVFGGAQGDLLAVHGELEGLGPGYHVQAVFDPVEGAAEALGEFFGTAGAVLEESGELRSFLARGEVGALGVFDQANCGDGSGIAGGEQDGDAAPAEHSAGGESPAAGDECVTFGGAVHGDGVEESVLGDFGCELADGVGVVLEAAAAGEGCLDGVRVDGVQVVSDQGVVGWG